MVAEKKNRNKGWSKNACALCHKKKEHAECFDKSLKSVTIVCSSREFSNKCANNSGTKEAKKNES